MYHFMRLEPWLLRILEADLSTVGRPNDYRVLRALNPSSRG
jgi:hypothetical protein